MPVRGNPRASGSGGRSRRCVHVRICPIEHREIRSVRLTICSARSGWNVARPRGRIFSTAAEQRDTNFEREPLKSMVAATSPPLTAIVHAPPCARGSRSPFP